jgi:hypothetical protein
MIRESSVGIAKSYWLDDRSLILGKGKGILLYSSDTRSALEHTHHQSKVCRVSSS